MFPMGMEGHEHKHEYTLPSGRINMWVKGLEQNILLFE